MIHNSLAGMLSHYAYSLNKKEPFTLSSGKISHEYIDCRKALSRPEVLLQASKEVYDLINLNSVTAIGGLTMGADPISIGVSMYSANKGHDTLKWFSIRKRTKAYGEKKLIEGDVRNGDNVVIVDDVITSGNSIIESVRQCKLSGLNVVKIIGLIDREESNGINNIKEAVEDYVDVSCICTLSQLRMLRVLR